MAQDHVFQAPAIGGLLRLAWQMQTDRLYEQLIAAGFHDVTRAQFALFRWPGVDGMRPGEAAESARLSKQTINGLLAELEANGYLVREVDPGDRRARVIRYTSRGRELQRTAHLSSQALERAWAAAVGEGRFRTLRATLESMVARALPKEPPGNTALSRFA